MSKPSVDADWVLTTLNDALAALEEAVMEIEGDPDSVAEILDERIPELYVKLNYAWNTRIEGPEAIDKFDHNDLVAFPKDIEL